MELWVGLNGGMTYGLDLGFEITGLVEYEWWEVLDVQGDNLGDLAVCLKLSIGSG